MIRPLSILLILTAGCASIDPMKPPDDRFAPLQQRQLSAFERVVAHDLHTGHVDGWTQLGNAWIAFANCQEIPEPKNLNAELSFLYATVQLESFRREFRIVDAIANKSQLQNETIGDALFSPAFFYRDAEKTPEHTIEWPGGDEKWGDEVPASIRVESQCNQLVQRVRTTKDDDMPRTYEQWFEQYLAMIDQTLVAAGRVPTKHRRGALAVTSYRIGMEGIRLANVKKSNADRAFRKLKRRAIQSDKNKTPEKNEGQIDPAIAIDEYRNLMIDYAKRTQSLVGHATEDLGEADLATLNVVRATLATELGETEAALKFLRDAGVSSREDKRFWMARYLELRLISEADQHGEVVKRFDNTLPPSGSRYFGPTAYRTAMSLKITDDTDRFLAVAKAAFQDKPYQSNPFLRALYFEVLQTLADAPFDDRVSEIIEELGPRGETYERVEQLARVALDRGRPENARAAASWLLTRDKNAKNRPRYHALAALASFLEDDVKTFKNDIRRVVYRSKDLLSAIPRDRRPAFFAHADAELVRILQQTLPIMAEWGDSKSAHARRQKWLSVIVAAAQDFLRQDNNSLSRPALVSLYRLASGLLKDDARGYAERVGKKGGASLILGTVEVTSRDLAKHEPILDFRLRPSFSLTLVPSSAPIDQWKSFWSETTTEGDDA